MVGDTDPPKTPVLLSFSKGNSRTSYIEAKGLFSVTPAPANSSSSPNENAAPLGKGNGAGANYQIEGWGYSYTTRERLCKAADSFDPFTVDARTLYLFESLIDLADDLEGDPDMEPSTGWVSRVRTLSGRYVTGCLEADLEPDGTECDSDESDEASGWEALRASRPPAIFNAAIPLTAPGHKGADAVVCEIDVRPFARGMR